MTPILTKLKQMTPFIVNAQLRDIGWPVLEAFAGRHGALVAVRALQAFTPQEGRHW